MFYFRINKIKVIDNRTSSFLFFKKDLADVKIISFVTTGNADLPDLDSWAQQNDPEKKKALLASAVSNIVASKILTEVDNVKDNQSLFFGDTGYVLFKSDNIPNDFNWCFVAVKSNRDMRALGGLIDGIVKDPGFDSFATNLATLVAGVANPAFMAGVAVSKFATGIISKILVAEGDEQIGLLYMSLDKTEHYPHGERKKDDVPDLTGNMRIDYSIFAADT